MSRSESPDPLARLRAAVAAMGEAHRIALAALADMDAAPAKPVLQRGRPYNPEERWATPERDAMLVRLYPGYTPMPMIIDELRKLPGPSWSSNDAVRTHASQGLKLRRPADLKSNPKAVEAAAMELVRASPATAPNVVDHMIRQDVAAQYDCPITFQDAVEWGRRHKPKGSSVPESLADVQAIRDYHTLPRYRIIPGHGPLGALPQATSGDSGVAADGKWRAHD